MVTAAILKELIFRLDKSILEFERDIKVTRGRIHASINRNGKLSDEIIDKIVDTYPQVNREWLETGQGKMLKTDTGDDLRNKKAFGEKLPKTLKLVPIKAQGGYTKHYMDPAFIDELEPIQMPGLEDYYSDEYRAFEVEGDSMEYYDDNNNVQGLPAGIYVVAKRIEPEFWQHTPQYYIHVIVTEDQILVKRLYQKDSFFVLISDNEHYEQILLEKEVVKELWLVKRKIDWNMPPNRRFKIADEIMNRINKKGNQ